MTIKSNYKTEDMFREYMYGESSMAEIVQKTGINRKTWNQRFSSLQRRKRTAMQNNNSGITGNRGSISGTNADNVTSEYRANKDNNRTNKFLQVLSAIAVMVAIYFIYNEIKKKGCID